MFEDVHWQGVGLGAILSFVAGWFYPSAKGFYPVWSVFVGGPHGRGAQMGAAFGRLVVGPVLYAVFVGVMMARGQAGPLIFGIFAVVVMIFEQRVQKTGCAQHLWMRAVGHYRPC